VETFSEKQNFDKLGLNLGYLVRLTSRQPIIESNTNIILNTSIMFPWNK